MKLRLVAAAACVIALVFATNCSPSTVNSLSYVDVQTGTATNHSLDPSAVTTIGNAPLAANTTGCFADGGAQPPPPYPWGTSNGTDSPQPGQCDFSTFVAGTWYFDFFSGNCAVVGQNSDVQGYMRTDSNGRMPVTVCTIQLSSAPSAGSHFAISGTLPSTVTVGAAGLSQTYGMPQLMVYNSSPALVTTVTATSVAGDGSSATFPFPTSLAQGTYMFAVKNFTGSSGQFKVVDATYYSVGGNPTLSSAFGVDASDTTTGTQVCIPGGGCHHDIPSTSAIPIVTQYNSNQVTYYTPNTSRGGLLSTTVPVGTRPVAAKLYGSYTANASWSPGGGVQVSVTTVFVPNAIVVNSGSNTVSLVNFVNNTSTTVGVGTQPMAVTLNSGATMAYVVNYGSGTLSEVNLSSQIVSRTANVAAGVQSVAMDPGGAYVWVGGTNTLYKVSLSTFAVVGTVPVSGTVTSLAASNAQNELVYTAVQNCCSGSSAYAANELKLSNLTQPATYAHASASPYAAYTMNGTLPSAATVPHASAVSAQFGNGMAASATPTGFIVYDVVSHKQLMAGTTPTPVRGIASDPLNTVVYLTVPDSNEYIVVPLPHL